MGRKITLDLNPELSRFLSQEQSRLQSTYGIKVTDKEILYTLIELHRLRVMSEAEERDSLLWYYDRVIRDDNAPKAARTPQSSRTPRFSG